MDRKNKVYAGIVTYCPDIKLLTACIGSICTQVEKVLVYDNHSENVTEVIKCIQNFANAMLICGSENIGIAGALNYIMNSAYCDGIKWVLLLDQDSICPDNMIYEYQKCIDEKIAVITPVINDVNDSKYIEKNDKIQEIVEFITSGSLNNVDAWRKIGGFDERLFIDMVDYDFAYRLNIAGYKALKNESVILNHQIGKMALHRIGSFTISTYNHSAFRKYYITRNSIYLAKKYPNFPASKHIWLRIIKRAVLVILFETDKYRKLCEMLRGILDVKKLYVR